MADKLKAITLGKTQEIESIHVDIADNDGIIVSWTIYTPSKAKSESGWDNHKEVFNSPDKALDRIKELFSAEMDRKIGEKSKSKK